MTDIDLTPEQKEEIFNFISEIEKKVNIDWKENSIRLGKLINTCCIELAKIEFMFNYRLREKTQERISVQELEKKADTFLKNTQNGFYSPGCFIHPETKEERYFHHKEVPFFLKMILTQSFIVPENIQDIRCCALTLKAAFYTLSEKEPLTKTFFILYQVLCDIVYKTADLKFEFYRREDERNRNKNNALQITQKRLNRIKKHSLYTQLKRILQNYNYSDDHNREIDKIVTKMKLTNKRKPDEKTIKKYRDFLIEDFQLENQEVK